MTFGINIFRADGDIVLSSQFVNYVFYTKTTFGTISNVPGIAPPLVFTTKLGSAVCSDVAIACPQITNNGDGTWNVSCAVVSLPPDQNNYATAVGTITSGEVYVFAAMPPNMSGMGIAFLGGNNAFAIEKASLIIKNRVLLDPAAASAAQSGKTRSVALGTPVRSWAGLINSSYSGAAGGTKLFDSSGRYDYTNGVSIGGIAASFSFPAANTVGSFGYGFASGGAVTGVWSVWCIDTALYQ